MKMNKAVAALALSLSILCVPAHGQKVEYPVDVYLVSNANIFLSSDPTNPLENRLDYLEGLGTSSQGVTNQNILLTDGSRVAQTFKIWNSNSLSAELLSNPDFSGSADHWSLTNCAYASDAIFITSGATAYLSYTGAVDIDLYATYQLSFDLIGTGPVATISARAGGITNPLSAVGTGATRVAFTVLTATSGPSLVITTTNSITVDNLSIKRITGGDAVDAGNRTIGGDVRIRGQVSGATNLALAATLTAETAARTAADTSIISSLAAEITARADSGTIFSNDITALEAFDTVVSAHYVTRSGANSFTGPVSIVSSTGSSAVAAMSISSGPTNTYVDAVDLQIAASPGPYAIDIGDDNNLGTASKKILWRSDAAIFTLYILNDRIVADSTVGGFGYMGIHVATPASNNHFGVEGQYAVDLTNFFFYTADAFGASGGWVRVQGTPNW